MKKVNFKKLTSQFFAGVFGLALMGGVMLNTQEAGAQDEYAAPISYLFGLIKTKPKCAHNAAIDENKGSIVCIGDFCEMMDERAGSNYRKCG